MNKRSVAFTRAEATLQAVRFLTETISTGLRMVSELYGIPQNCAERGVRPFSLTQPPWHGRPGQQLNVFRELSLQLLFTTHEEPSWPIS